MADAIAAMKEAFRQLSAGEATTPLRSRIEVPEADGVVLFMPSLLHTSGELGVKIVAVYPDNIPRGLPTIHAIVMVFDPETGRPQAIIEGGSLTAIRTGAASGAATDLLARPDAGGVAIFGSGVQARTQLEAVCTVRQIERAWVFSLDGEGAQAFVEEMAGKGPVPQDLIIAKSPDQAIARADIICTATTSSTPVFEGRQLKPGTHINAIGAFTPEMQELDAETVRRAFVVVDSREATLAEAGDLIIPLERGEIPADWIRAELGEIVAGSRPGRTDPEQITLFKSVGVAVQDAAAAGTALANAQKMGLGRLISI